MVKSEKQKRQEAKEILMIEVLEKQPTSTTESLSDVIEKLEDRLGKPKTTEKKPYNLDDYLDKYGDDPTAVENIKRLKEKLQARGILK
jgi:DNA polymerase II large subunit